MYGVTLTVSRTESAKPKSSAADVAGRYHYSSVETFLGSGEETLLRPFDVGAVVVDGNGASREGMAGPNDGSNIAPR